jgi:hypothetical protein
MSDALEVARTLRDKAASPSLRDYWQQVMDGIERNRARENKS